MCALQAGVLAGGGTAPELTPYERLMQSIRTEHILNPVSHLLEHRLTQFMPLSSTSQSSIECEHVLAEAPRRLSAAVALSTVLDGWDMHTQVHTCVYCIDRLTKV